MNATLALFLADLTLFSHVLVVVFVIGGLVLTLLGGLLQWRWVRNFWFRLLHLICIGVVVMQAWFGVVCPLTTLEMWLRRQADAEVYQGSFISYWMQTLLYYDLPSWMFTLAYTLFASAVVASWVWVRPFSLRQRVNMNQ